jgi:ribosomal protein L20A (L18A)
LAQDESVMTPLTRKVLAQSNEQLVYKVLKEIGSKHTIPEIASQIPSITERTVRRCVDDLVKQGYARKYGRRGNATLYGLADKSMYSEAEGFEEIEIIPFGGELLTVQAFLEMMVSLEENPFNDNPEINLLRSPVTNGIRRAMAGTILTTNSTGQEAYLQKAAGLLLSIEQELRYVLKLLDSFNASGVWFDQYRDRIAFQVRRAQQMNPDLIQLAIDFVRSE